MVPKKPIEAYAKVTENVLSRLDIFFKTFEMAIAMTTALTSNNTSELLSEYYNLKQKIIKNGYVWLKD